MKATCPHCKHVVEVPFTSKAPEKCPQCGKPMVGKLAKGCGCLSAATIVLLGVVYFLPDPPTGAVPAASPPVVVAAPTVTAPATSPPAAAAAKTPLSQPLPATATTAPVAARAWYEGGTLTQETGTVWRKADAANKLATCADFVTAAHTKNLLDGRIARRIKTVDDVRPLAQECVTGLDNALSGPESDTMPVASAAALLMGLMGWVKK
jgi:hypothetical protein